VDVLVPVETGAAAALADSRNREAAGRLISRILNPRAGSPALKQAVAELKADVKAAGLTDAEIDTELEAYKTVRRDGPTVM
jgi:hypothetical protein